MTNDRIDLLGNRQQATGNRQPHSASIAQHRNPFQNYLSIIGTTIRDRMLFSAPDGGSFLCSN